MNPPLFTERVGRFGLYYYIRNIHEPTYHHYEYLDSVEHLIYCPIRLNPTYESHQSSSVFVSRFMAPAGRYPLVCPELTVI